jgi:HEAT repeat protein
MGSLFLLTLPARAMPKTDDVSALIQQVLKGPSVAADRAAEKLRFLGPDKAGPPLRALMQSPDPHTRVAVSSALVIVRDPASVKLLQKAVTEDESWEVRRNAANGLGSLKAKSATPALEKALRSDSKTVVRTSCIRALKNIGGGAETLAEVSAKDASLELRRDALDALALQKNKSVRSKLRPLLTDSSELLRFATARALAWQDDPEGQKFLEKALASTEPSVAGRAITASSDVPTKWAVELFVKALSYPDLDVSLAAAKELARRKDERGTRHLVRVAMQRVPQAEAAQTTLDSLGISAADRARLAELP